MRYFADLERIHGVGLREVINFWSATYELLSYAIWEVGVINRTIDSVKLHCFQLSRKSLIFEVSPERKWTMIRAIKTETLRAR